MIPNIMSLAIYLPCSPDSLLIFPCPHILPTAKMVFHLLSHQNIFHFVIFLFYFHLLYFQYLLKDLYFLLKLLFYQIYLQHFYKFMYCSHLLTLSPLLFTKDIFIFQQVFQIFSKIISVEFGSFVPQHLQKELLHVPFHFIC